MTVQELIDKLNKIENKNIKILIASDEEGNYFDYLYNIEESFIRKEIKDRDELYPIHPDDLEEYIKEEGEENFIPCLVIWP